LQEFEATPAPTPAVPNYVYPAFWAGFCSGVLSGVPILNEGCCLWISGAGTLAVYFFQLKNGYNLKRVSDGARLGAFTGFWGFLFSTIVGFGSQVLLRRGVGNLIAAFHEQMQASMPTDPQTKEAVAWAMTKEGTVSLLVVGATMYCVIYMLVRWGSARSIARNQVMARRGARDTRRSCLRPLLPFVC
jgi:hypothetical protein